MIVSDLMTSPARTCRADDPCATAAQIMWDTDCGCVPVTDVDGTIAGVVTDRDLCMAAHTTGRPLTAIGVAHAMNPHPRTVRANRKADDALALMADAQVHRLPVVDAKNRVIGVLALSDVLLPYATRIGKRAAPVVATLAAISRRRDSEPVVELAPARKPATRKDPATGARKAKATGRKTSRSKR